LNIDDSIVSKTIEEDRHALLRLGSWNVEKLFVVIRPLDEGKEHPLG